MVTRLLRVPLYWRIHSLLSTKHINISSWSCHCSTITMLLDFWCPPRFPNSVNRSTNISPSVNTAYNQRRHLKILKDFISSLELHGLIISYISPLSTSHITVGETALMQGDLMPNTKWTLVWWIHIDFQHGQLKILHWDADGYEFH